MLKAERAVNRKLDKTASLSRDDPDGCRSHLDRDFLHEGWCRGRDLRSEAPVVEVIGAEFVSVARKLFLDLPVSRKLVVILWLFLAIVIGLLGLSYVTIENLSAARAYVGGEGLWSKPEHSLTAYASRSRRCGDRWSGKAGDQALRRCAFQSISHLGKAVDGRQGRRGRAACRHYVGLRKPTARNPRPVTAGASVVERLWR